MDLPALLKQWQEIEDLKKAIDEDEDKKVRRTILLTHIVSQKIILKAANKLIQGSVLDDRIFPEIEEITIPEDKPHNFRLGDWVKIKCSRFDFKSIQKRTLGWNPRLNTVYGHHAIVVQVSSEYDNSIQLHFPKVMAGCTLYAPVLTRLKHGEIENPPSRWKPDDIVKVVSDPLLAQLLQREFENDLKQHLGAKGRVTATSKRFVAVTFNESESCLVHPAALLRSTDRTPIEKPQAQHSHGFKVGEMAKMISNVEKLIKNQEGKGGWTPQMIKLRGQKVTIVGIQPDDIVVVQANQKPAWPVSVASVLKDGQVEPDSVNNLDFIPGDIVKIHAPNDLRLLLHAAKIPLSFLDLLRCPVKVITIDDDMDLYFRVTSHRHIDAKPTTLRMATTKEAEKYTQIQGAVKNLKKNDTVHLDVGPPNYVDEILAHAGADAPIKMAMTKSSTLIGFTDPTHAVIEYKNGMRFKINKKYLTVPEKYNIPDSQEEIAWETVNQIKKQVSEFVREAHGKEEPMNEEWKVDVIAMSSGIPPFVNIKVQSLLADPSKVSTWLVEKTVWSVTPVCEGQLLLDHIEGHKGQVKVGIFFNDDELGSLSSATDMEMTESITIFSGGEVETKAMPIFERQESRPGPRVEEPPPNVESVTQFKYLRLSHHVSGQEMYLPYVVKENHGNRRNVQQPTTTTQQQQNTSITNVETRIQNV